MLTGDLLIGGRAVRGTNGEIYGLNAATGERLPTSFGGASEADLDQAAALAWDAFPLYRETALEARAAFLEKIAEEILAIGDDLITRAMAETGLPRGRLEGERGRTMGQLRLFASELRAGRFQDVRIDPADPERKPAPKPDLRLRNIAIGPVAVFGASNFPLAFSVAGGDTASALAAGCPVIVKAHSAHPGTSELVGRAVQKAVAESGMPEGTFALLYDSGLAIGQALVADPRIRAVGFTGSRAGGLALMAVAAKRKQPIPVYAEMSSINPVILFPEALQARGRAIGTAFAGSLTLGAGQFCTNPGLLLALEGPGLDDFLAGASEALSTIPAQTMLTAGIAKAYAENRARLAGHEAVKLVAEGQEGEGAQGRAGLFETDAAQFLADHALQDEVFGATGLVVRCRDLGELEQVLDALEGQLTIALHISDGDEADARRLLPKLELLAGRILVNGFGTGVEVSPAMVHGGPYPATSDGRSTSVGTRAIERFLRPVSYQDLPEALRPAALR
ncbi:aldehyde dehydrogenase (NADP(+)) [Rhizobium sp. YIM 134829]|uniref:aldehyde dehydrogenase (NADP(+)) n=1 Tax=Rhizobium sp. YIM 134829 TaxID=3390453 RepID=UPI0039785783